MYDPVPSGALASIPAEGWHVVLDNDQQGPMSRGTLLERLGDRSDAGECWVWREGFADWRRAGEIEGLSELISFNEAATAAVVEANPTTAMPDPGADDRTQVMSSEQREVAQSEAADRREIEAVSAEQSLDSLFGDEAAEAASDGGEFFDVPENASVDEALLYQRQDTSVLFTLDDFDRKADGGPGDSIGIGDGLGERTPESGLIDIRAIARNRVEQDDGSAKGERLFTGEAGPRVATQWRKPVTTRLPVGYQPLLRSRAPSRFWQTMAMGMGVAFVAVVIVGGSMLLLDEDDPIPPVAVAPLAVVNPPALEAVPAPKVGDEASPAEEPLSEVSEEPPVVAVEAADVAASSVVDAPPVAPPAPTPDMAAAEEPEAKEPVRKKAPLTEAQKVSARAAAEKRAQRRAEKKAARAAAKDAAREAAAIRKAEKKAASQTKVRSSKTASSKKKNKGSEATALLNSLGGSSDASVAKTSPKGPSGDGASAPAKLSPSVIRRTIRKVHSRVVACHRDQGGGAAGVKIVKAKLIVRGSGAVASASVGSPFAGTAAGSCMVGVLKGVQFPAFAGESQTVRIPFRL